MAGTAPPLLPPAVPDWTLMVEEDKIRLFNSVLDAWREDLSGLARVPPRLVVPDTTNRANTGLSVDHVHWIATKIGDEGFVPRSGSGTASKGHDMPILIRESRASPLGPESLAKWRRQQAEDPGFPPLRVGEPWAGASPGTFFASLGNGHFFQALNLYGAEHPRRWTGDGSGWAGSQAPRYLAVRDPLLKAAIKDGVEAVVLRPEIPRRERRFLSEVLNSSFSYTWLIGGDGTVHINPTKSEQRDGQGTAFDSLSKSLDSHELNALVQQKLRADAKRKARRQSKL